MGGHVAGEVASRVAVEAIEAFIQETAGADKNRTWPFPFEPQLSLEGNRLKAAFRLANRRIASAIADSQDLRGMATTASAMLVGRITPRRARRRQPRLRVARGRPAPDHRRPLVGRGAGARRHADARRGRQHPWRNVVTRALSGRRIRKSTSCRSSRRRRSVPALLRRTVRRRGRRSASQRSWATERRRSRDLRSPDRCGQRGRRPRQHHRAGHPDRCSITSRRCSATGASFRAWSRGS